MYLRQNIHPVIEKSFGLRTLASSCKPSSNVTIHKKCLNRRVTSLSSPDCISFPILWYFSLIDKSQCFNVDLFS